MIDLETVLAAAFNRIECGIRLGIQLGKGRAVYGCACDTDRRTDRQRGFSLRVGLAQGLSQCTGQLFDHCIAVQMFEQDDKLVTAQTRDQVVPSELMTQRIGHIAQHLVALGVTHSVVDLLEVVKIQNQEGLHALGFASQVQIHPFFEGLTVKQAGQEVVLRAAAEVNGLLPTALDLHILLFLLLVVFQNADNARICAQSINVEQHDLKPSHLTEHAQLHEKPFEGINGSGKHNNWSISTERGENLLEPGNTPSSNAQFLLFLTAVIKAVDEYQDLLRLSAASAGNDHRLGAHEAPPAVVSMYIGDELGAVVDAMVSGKTYHAAEKTHMDIGVSALPNIPKDTSDRNRTSPFAFTGNKFEFRMPGSTFNVACTNTILNTAVAEELRQFADELEQAENFEQALSELIIREIKAHKRIIFNGNGYDDAWLVEAKKRGLSNLASTPDALPHYTDKKNLQLFTRHGVYTPVEVGSREEILLEEYAKTLRIEALTMLDMLRKLILPACAKFSRDLAEGVALKKQIGVDAPAEVEMVRKVTDKTAALCAAQDVLAHKVEAAKDVLTEAFAVAPGGVGARKLSRYYRDEVLPAMKEARKLADELENLVSKEYWPFPTYSDILFYV